MSRNKFFTRIAAALALLTLLFTPFLAGSALAHGHTNAGDYELVIGFHNEPAYQGEPNGLDLFVTNTKTNTRVNDLADTLKAEIIYGATKKELQLKPQWGQDGAYTAYLVPTAAGDYSWHIWGSIEGTPVDVTMQSSPDTFSPVEAKSEVDFPTTDPTSTDLQSQAAAAAQTAQTALIVGIVGAVLGVVGIVVGVMGMRARKA